MQPARVVEDLRNFSKAEDKHPAFVSNLSQILDDDFLALGRPVEEFEFWLSSLVRAMVLRDFGVRLED